MSRQLIEFSTLDGGSVLLESTESSSRGEVARGRQGSVLVERAENTFDDALRRLRPAMRSVLASVRESVDPPQEIGVEFGIALSAEAGAFIAAASTTANFRVTLTWKQGGQPQ